MNPTVPPPDHVPAEHPRRAEPEYPHRSAPDRPRRSDATRAAILTAARERFAADGYERATIRTIAADAGIDPAMVMRYYGSKEKLFAAAAEFDLRLPDLAELPADGIGAPLVRHMLRRWEGDETLFALLRAAVSHEAAAERMRQIFGAQLAPALARVCPDPADAARRAGLVATQMLGLALTRYILRLPPVVAMSPDELATWLGPTLDRYLTTPEP
ncbi:TetR family transcriptional regulator [Micromonospora sp. CPCC 206060]|uniref:TetR/AcrR family transcriptional regulator n=1 Tax=Micromonospora sp. CPCC 206060 TaxID=3122406 RepID=UPI002FF3C4BB